MNKQEVIDIIEGFLKEWENKEGSKNSYYYEIPIVDNNNNEDYKYFDEELINLLEKINIKYILTGIGSFDSPDYDANYECLVIYIEEELISFPIIHEYF